MKRTCAWSAPKTKISLDSGVFFLVPFFLPIRFRFQTKVETRNVRFALILCTMCALSYVITLNATTYTHRYLCPLSYKQRIRLLLVYFHVKYRMLQDIASQQLKKILFFFTKNWCIVRNIRVKKGHNERHKKVNYIFTSFHCSYLDLYFIIINILY